jgi:hypothetical protein
MSSRETPRGESRKKRVEKTQKPPTSGQTEAQRTPTSGQPERPALPAAPTAKRPRTSTSEKNNRTKNPRMTNSIRGTVSGTVQVEATPDVTSDPMSNPSITSSAMRRRAARSSRPNPSVSHGGVYTAPTPSEVLSAVSRVSNGSRSVMHQNSMSLAFVLNMVKRLLEQHTMKHQPFLPEDELMRVSREYNPRRGFYLSC